MAFYPKKKQQQTNSSLFVLCSFLLLTFCFFLFFSLFTVMSNDECSAYVRSKMSEGYHDLDYICEALIDTCLEKGSRDNMSAVIVSLPAAVFGEKKISPYWKPGQNTGGTPQQGR